MIYEISIVKNGQKCGAIMMNNDHFQLNSSEIINAIPLRNLPTYTTRFFYILGKIICLYLIDY